MSDGIYALHAVIVKKPIALSEAKRIAADIINDPKKEFYRETGTSIRFRSISKQKFVPKTFRTKKVNKQVSLVFGRLRPEWEHLEGAGLFDMIKSGISKVKEFFKPRLDSYNNKSTETIRQYGSLPIKSLQIMRTPVGSMLNTALNFVSLGKWNELKQKYGFDKLFHLALVANVGSKNIIMEKNEVVNISTEFKTSRDTEVFNIDLGGRQLTPSQILETARKNVGDRTFFDYAADTNNCQHFIRMLLEGQGLYTQAAADFLFQDVGQIFKEMPSYVSTVAKAVTTTGAIFNKITGQGNDEGDMVVKQVKSQFPTLMTPAIRNAFYEYVKQKAGEKEVGLYFIQQLYPKFLKSKELKDALAAKPDAKPAKPAKSTPPGKQADITKFFKKTKEGGARSHNLWILALRRWNEQRGYKPGDPDSTPWCVPRGKDSAAYKEVKKISDELKGGLSGGAMSAPLSAWLEGLKWFNSRSKDTYCIPIKGTPQHAEIKAYQRTKLEAPQSLWRIKDRPPEALDNVKARKAEANRLLYSANTYNDKAYYDSMTEKFKKEIKDDLVSLLVHQAREGKEKDGKRRELDYYRIVKDWKPNRKLPPSVVKRVEEWLAEEAKEAEAPPPPPPTAPPAPPSTGLRRRR